MTKPRRSTAVSVPHVQFGFTDEQEQFRSTVRRFLTDKSPTAEVRRLMATGEGYDRGVWRQMSEELALPSIPIPERYGGSGFGMVELGIVMEEMGRVLLCSPYFSTAVLGAGAIMNAGTDEQKSALLPGVASGACLATLATTEPDGNWDLSTIKTVATPDADAYRLDGVKSFVVDGHIADLIIVAARVAGSGDGKGLGLFTIDRNAEGLDRRLLESMDATRKIARIEFRGAQAKLLGEVDRASAIIRTLDQAAVALANEMVGGAQTMLESAVSYAKLRVQFGRPIGSFQAIKHKLADMLLEVELAKSSAYCAAQAAAVDDPEWPAIANLAKAAASEAYVHAATECIQIHGGIGFTWDNDTHLWFKRAKSSEVFLGQPSYHRELLMQRWGV